MKREIKFRVINKTWICAYETLSETGWSHELTNNGKVYEGPFRDRTWGHVKALTRQQYTGLKDKNGKEIYEGDITIFAEDKIGVDRYRVILFKGGCFQAVQYNDSGRSIISSAFGRDGHPEEDYEVVGNVFSNPELLTQ